MAIIQGRLEPFFETGTEGIVWSLEDRVLPGYDGLFSLRAGDHLTVFDEDGKSLWSGIINLEYERERTSYPQNPEYSQQAINGYWVHGFQRDLEPEMWANWFFDGRRASLIPFQVTEAHPLHASAAELPDLLRQLPEKTRIEYANGVRYQWIAWFGRRIDDADDGQPRCEVSGTSGVHADLGFTESEALWIIGSPPAETVRAWQLYEKLPVDEAALYRLALLIGITGRLILIYGRDKARMIEFIAPIRDSFFTIEGLIQSHKRHIAAYQSD